MSKVTLVNLVKTMCAERYETTDRETLEDTYGKMFSAVKKTPGRYVVGTSYYYESQNMTTKLVEEIRTFAAKHGFTVETVGCIGFYTKPWPKTSWAQQTIVISPKLS